MEELSAFNPVQLGIVNEAVVMAEERVIDFYKMSDSQWVHLRYDVKTLSDLETHEIVDGPFAQVIRYEGKLRGHQLGSSAYDFYQICLQDHSILSALDQFPDLEIFPFALYIVTHELIHIVRFSKFLQNFDASDTEKMAEEIRVHEHTHEILSSARVSGLGNVFEFYKKWRMPFDQLS